MKTTFKEIHHEMRTIEGERNPPKEDFPSKYGLQHCQSGMSQPKRLKNLQNDLQKVLGHAYKMNYSG